MDRSSFSSATSSLVFPISVSSYTIHLQVSTPLTRCFSYLFTSLFRCCILAQQLPCGWRSFLQVDPVHLPRSSGGRVFGHPCRFYLSHLRGGFSSSGLRVSSCAESACTVLTRFPVNPHRNGAWMATGGFLMPLPQLNPFYKYVFHCKSVFTSSTGTRLTFFLRVLFFIVDIDYQAYVFQGLMVNEFAARTYTCDDACQCSYPTLGEQCRIPGISVLARYGYPTNRQGQWIGILVSIIAVYRLLCLLVVYIKKR